MRAFVACPSGRYAFADWLPLVLEWMRGEDAGIRVRTSNRVDYGRSLLIAEALRLSPEWTIMIDSDVLPITSMREVLELARENLSAGYGVSVSPLRSIAGTVLARPVIRIGDTPPPTDRPWDVYAASAGFVVVSLDALLRLSVLGTFTNDAANVEHPAYCHHTLDETEDSVLFRNFSRGGVRICADPRMEVLHLKPAGIPSYGAEGKDVIYEHSLPGFSGRNVSPEHNSVIITEPSGGSG